MSLARIPILRHGLTVWDKSLLSEDEVQRRLARVRGAMRARDLDALVVYSDMAQSGDVAYLTNFHSFDPRMPGLVLVTAEHVDAIFKVTSRDLTYISKYVWVSPLSVDFLSGSLAGKLADVVAQRGLEDKRCRVGAAGALLAPAGLLQGIEDAFPAGTVEPAEALLAALRRRKSAAERTILRLAAAKCEDVLAGLAAAMTPGLTEGQLAAQADYLARRAGAQDVEVLLYTAAADKGAWPRGHFPFRPAAERALPTRGTVGVYLALQYHGYWAELSQSLVLGAPDSAQIEAQQLARASFDELAGALRPGAGDGGHAAAWIHGIGLDRDESPLSGGDGVLRDGDVAAAHVAVRRAGDLVFFGRAVAVSQATAPLVPPAALARAAGAAA